MLHRNVRKILLKLRAVDDTRKILHRERLRGEAASIARHMVRRGVFSKASYNFNGIIALGQFVTLGMVLVANLSAIHSILVELSDEYKPKPAAAVTTAKPDADDIGEEIPLRYATPTTAGLQEMPKSVDSTGQLVKNAFEYRVSKDILKGKEKRDKKQKKKKGKEKKKTKKRNAIDDIFG